MSSEERKKILEMVELGKINAEEAMKLMKAMDGDGGGSEGREDPAGGKMEPEMRQPDPEEFKEIEDRARSLWQIPLWAGVTVTVLSSYWLFTLVTASNYGFWFFFAMFLLLLGVLMLVLFAGSLGSHWLYVKVEPEPGEWPRHIVFGMPLPLGLAGWVLRNFGSYINGLDQTQVDEIIELLSTGFSSKEPVIVNVHEGAGHERVQVYIG